MRITVPYVGYSNAPQADTGSTTRWIVIGSVLVVVIIAAAIIFSKKK